MAILKRTKLHRQKKIDAAWADDPLWKMVGAGASKERDLSVHHDKYLYNKCSTLSIHPQGTYL